LEIFFVNEKVCFGKQNSQYTADASDDWRRNRQSSIAVAATMLIFHSFRVVFLHHLV